MYPLCSVLAVGCLAWSSHIRPLKKERESGCHIYIFYSTSSSSSSFSVVAFSTSFSYASCNFNCENRPNAQKRIIVVEGIIIPKIIIIDKYYSSALPMYHGDMKIRFLSARCLIRCLSLSFNATKCACTRLQVYIYTRMCIRFFFVFVFVFFFVSHPSAGLLFGLVLNRISLHFKTFLLSTESLGVCRLPRRFHEKSLWIQLMKTT